MARSSLLLPSVVHLLVISATPAFHHCPMPPSLIGAGSSAARQQNHHSHHVTCWSTIASTQVEDESQPTFSELYDGRIPSWLLTRAENLGFKRPTMVQQETLGAVLDGQDVVIQAQTGTGKTLAFMLPLLASIDTRKKAVQALVVVPSRELGLQVASVAKQLAAGRIYYQDEELEEEGGDDDEEAEGSSKGQQQGGGKILVMSLLEGSKNRRQKAWALAEPPQVIIGNPLALSSLVEHRGIRYHQVKMVVIDEVDACLINRDTRAQLQALLCKYLSPSYLTAELEEEAALDVGGGRSSVSRSFEEDYNLPQGVMKESGGGKDRTSETALAPWRLMPRQTIFCSATIPQHNHFIKQCVQQQWTLNQPVHFQVTPGELMPPQLKHNYLVCPSKTHKLSALRSLLKREVPRGMQACAVFTSDDWEAQEIAKRIGDLMTELFTSSSSVEKDARSSGGSNNEEDASSSSSGNEGLQALISRDHIKRRASIMEDFRSGASRVLVTTDFAARGLDIPQISHVVMYDIPTDADTYLHRGGRAGRMGRPGTVTSLVSETEEFALLRLANSLKIELKRLGVLKAGSGKSRSKDR